MVLSKERQGEIALAMVKHRLREAGFEVKPNTFKRQLGSLSKDINVPIEELEAFMKPMIIDLVNEALK